VQPEGPRWFNAVAVPLAGVAFGVMAVTCGFENHSRGLRIGATAVLLAVGWLGIIRGWLRPPALGILMGALGAVFAALLIATIFSIDPTYSAKTLFRQHFWFLLLVPAIAAVFADPGRQRWALVGLAAAGVVAAIPGIVLYFKAQELQEAGWIRRASDFVWYATDDLGRPYQRARGMLESYTRSALVQVFALAALVALGMRALEARRWVHLAIAVVAAGVCAFFLLLTKSRGAWGAAGMAMIITFVCCRGKWWILIAGAILGALLLTAMPQERARAATIFRQLGQPDLLLSGRLSLWRQGFPAIASSPLVGIGHGPNIFLRPAAQERGLALLTDRPQPDLHSFYLQTQAESGAVGMLAYLVLFGVLLRRAGTAWRSGAATSPATQAATGVVVSLLIVGVIYCFNEDHIGQLFWSCLGLLAAVSGPAPPESPPHPDPESRPRA